MMRPKVYVGMPSGDGFPYPDVIISIYNQTCVHNGDVDLFFYDECIIKRKPVQHARNEILNNFLKSGCTHLWFVDDDNPPAFDVLEKLLSHGKDLVSAIVPIRGGDKYLLNVFKNGKHLESYAEFSHPLIEIDNCGTGCVLMTREIVERMVKKFDGNPYQFRIEEFVCKKDGTIEIYQAQEKWADKNDYIIENGELKKVIESISEDLFFGREAKKLGYKFYADVRCHCTHYKDVNKLKVRYEKSFYIDTDNKPDEGEWGEVYGPSIEPNSGEQGDWVVL